MLEKEIRSYLEKGEITTPCYIFDYDELNVRFQRLKQVFGETGRFCYAIKANPFLIQGMDMQLEKYEVCSPGELEICVENGIDMRKVVFSGVNKGIIEMERALDQKVGVITIESEMQWKWLLQCIDEKQGKVNVLLRLTSGAQFGLEKSELEEIIRTRNEHLQINILGIQYFSGTQKKKIEKISEELNMLHNFCVELERKYDYKTVELEYGPGLYFPYFQGEMKDDLEGIKVIRSFFEVTKHDYQVIIELGRYIAATCGHYITQIVDLKRNHGGNFCLVDGGIHQMNYYGQNMAMRIPQISHIAAKKTEKKYQEVLKWTICGSLCTFADVLLRGYETDQIAIGDWFVFYNLGAYSVMEGMSLFLSRNLPAVYVYSKKEGLTVQRKPQKTYCFNFGGGKM